MEKSRERITSAFLLIRSKVTLMNCIVRQNLKEVNEVLEEVGIAKKSDLIAEAESFKNGK